MFDLTVQTLHSFYVADGQVDMLVHNIDCTEWAQNYVDENGGEMYRIEPPGDAPSLGQYQLQPGYPDAQPPFSYHDVVVNDGMVHDPYTPDGGVPVDDWKQLWDEGVGIEFPF